jgi:hypothetical protein
MEDNKKPEVVLSFRIPADLHEQLTKWAKEDSRSLNAHLIYLLREKAKEKYPPATPKNG